MDTRQQADSVRPPEDHYCSVYERDDERVASLLRFIRGGLERHEACVCVTEEALTTPVTAALTLAGIDTVGEADQGSLAILTPNDYGLVGKFRAEAMIASLAEASQKAEELGFEALRVAEDMTWTLELAIAPDEVRRYEALLNAALSHSTFRHLCLYDRRRFAPAAMVTALHTHRQVALGQQLFANPYFEPPQLVLDNEISADRVAWMLQQLRRYPIIS